MKKLWHCPKCGRQFERHSQSHSCKPYVLEMHFEGKPGGKLLYEKFKRTVKKEVGFFQIESLACCIHFVRRTTFAAVKIFKEKIQVDFSLSRIVKNKRIVRAVQLLSLFLSQSTFNCIEI